MDRKGNQEELPRIVPDLPKDDFEELKRDIVRNGVVEPIKVDEDGQVLDGHQRKRACRELGLPQPDAEEVAGLDFEGKLRYIVEANDHRLGPKKARHTSEARQETAVNIWAFTILSQEEAGDITGVSQWTVSRFANLLQLTTEGTLGKNGVLQRPRGRLPGVTGDIETPLYRLIRSGVPGLAKRIAANSIDVIHADISGVFAVEHEKHLLDRTHALSLARLAASTLKPGGHLVMVMEREDLPLCFTYFHESLVYADTFVYELEGARWTTEHKTQDWRPVVWFTKGKSTKPVQWPPDGFGADEDDPARITGQWSSVVQEDLLPAFARPGDTVLDPTLSNLGVILVGAEMGVKVIAATEDDPSSLSEFLESHLYGSFYNQLVDLLEMEVRETNPLELRRWVMQDRDRFEDFLTGAFPGVYEDATDLTRKDLANGLYFAFLHQVRSEVLAALRVKTDKTALKMLKQDGQPLQAALANCKLVGVDRGNVARDLLVLLERNRNKQVDDDLWSGEVRQ